jgi:hypothetical protein
MVDIESTPQWQALQALKSRELLLRALTSKEMNPDLPPGFAPKQVIYREIEPDLTRPLHCRYRDIDAPTPIDAAFPGIEKFAMNAAAGGYRRNKPNLPEDNPLSIPVDRDSFIILQLATEFRDWQFFAEGEAVMLGDPAGPTNPWAFYGDLKYVRIGQQPADPPTPAAPMPSCQLVYFAARFVEGTFPNPYRQKFTFLVDVDVDTTVHVDPDIRHPGNVQP